MKRLFLDTNIVIDALLRTGELRDAEVIITRNGKDFTASRLPVMTATEYLATTEK